MKRIVKSEEKLREACEPIKFMVETGIDKTQGLEIIEQLKEVLEAKPKLVALAAPQIGIKSRIFCIKFDGCIKTFMNPIITKKSEPKFICETCASFPNKQILLLRPTELEVKYYNEEFKYEDNKLLGTAASLFDQQYQLLDGQLPIDLGLVSDIEADGEITDADLADETFVKSTYELYKQLITVKTSAAISEVESDDDSKKLFNQLAFTEKVINGRAQVISEDNPALDKKTATKIKMATNSFNKQKAKANLVNFLAKKGR